MVATLKDVAELAGVSRSAVSRTFTEGASVSSKTRKKVQEAATELGYRPNFLARSLTTRRTKMIGLVSNNFHNPIFLQVFDLFTKGLQERGLRPLLVNLSDETDPQNSLEMLRQYSVDGVVIASSTLPPDFAEAFQQVGMPVVHTFGRYTNTPKVNIVGIDNKNCGRIAAEHLVSKGYSNIAFMGGPQSATSTQDRLEGFMAALSERPDIKKSFSYADAYTYEAGFREMSRLIAEDHAEAYFCGDDVLSIGALSAVRKSGRNVPNDIGIIGLNDMEMSSWGDIDLTTIRQPIEQIIAAAIDVIVESLEKPDGTPATRLFPCTVVERGTLRA